MVELNPCPFCGDDRDGHNPDCYLDLCNRIGRGETFTPSVMEAAWNRRAPQPDASAEGREGEAWREFATAVLMGLPLWPNQWPQEVSMVAWAIHNDHRLAPKTADVYTFDTPPAAGGSAAVTGTFAPSAPVAGSDEILRMCDLADKQGIGTLSTNYIRASLEAKP